MFLSYHSELHTGFFLTKYQHQVHLGPSTHFLVPASWWAGPKSYSPGIPELADGSTRLSAASVEYFAVSTWVTMSGHGVWAGEQLLAFPRAGLT